MFFSSGRLAATGSADFSIKILDVDRMMSKTAIGHNQDLHPVIRTLYDHSDVSEPWKSIMDCFTGLFCEPITCLKVIYLFIIFVVII